jgi:hypothetical protein
MSEEKDDKWEMPTPVFRSTTGSLPKSFEETISQSFSPDVEQGRDEDDDILSLNALPPPPTSSEKILDDHAEPADREEARDAERDALVEQEPVRQSFWSFTAIFLLIAIAAAAVVIGILYFVRARGDAY